MKNKILRSLTCGLLVLSTTAVLLRADRDADRRNERIPFGHKMHTPLHRLIRPSDSSSPTGNGYAPQEMRHAYGFDQLGTTGKGQVIAIIDAYGSPTIQADLDAFCQTYNIPSTTIEICYPQGQPETDPFYPTNATETSLDVEWAHAIAPGATIMLVVAQSLTPSDLFAAVDYAVSLGANQVSMSWGGSEYDTEGSSDFHFNVPGVTFFASSGDNGAGVQYPAVSPYVVGVGGTTLNLDSSGNFISEAAWSGSGGGASLYEAAPSYQAGWLSGSGRGVPDVAYDADPSTGVPVYITGFGWVQVGGTSMAAPQWAALCALANSLRSQPIGMDAPGILYSLATTGYMSYFRDITSGNNGAYSAGIGYDLVTGLGAPIANQLVPALAGGLSSQAAAPVFSPPAGAYPNSSAQNVGIISATPGASIRYTLDGSTPTETNGTLYSGPVLISANTTLAAIAYENGLTDSAVTSGSYTFLPQVAAPSFSPAAGTYANAQKVTITPTPGGATIRYTIDGSAPTETHGTLYSGPVNISGPVNLKAIAYVSGFIASQVTSGFYTFTNLNVTSSFTGSNNGGLFPFAGLIQGSDGNFYGTTFEGGSSGGYGTIFNMTPTGVFTTLVLFNGADGSIPSAGLVQGNDGNFYGTTEIGGSSNGGTVFEMTPSGVLTSLVSFTGPNGLVPQAGLVQGSDGNFYGTTVHGGSDNNGTVFMMTPAGVLTTLVLFNGANGYWPYAGLVQGNDGNFYGTTSAGNNNSGTVFKMTPAGVLTTLVSFDVNGTNGYLPAAGLVQGSDGNFYGTTELGGTYGDGTVFKMTPPGVLTTLVSFNGTNGLSPVAGVVQGSDGNFYGTTEYGGCGGDGTVFQVTPAGVLTTLASFDAADGQYPLGGVIQGSDGNFYGTTEQGGPSGYGVIFQLSAPPLLPQAVAPAFSPSAGTYTSAQTVAITSTTTGASIHYTTDGSTPTETNGKLYSSPVSITNTTTLAAIAYENGFSDSPVTSGVYTIIPPPLVPVFSPAGSTFTSAQLVTITSSGATAIYYTTDGTTPTSSSTPYTAPITIANDTVLQAIGVNSGGFSPVASATFTIVALTPVFSPVPGTYSSAQNVTMTSATSGASIRYTTDGSTPSETNGTIYSGSVTISATTTLKAIAYKTGLAGSSVTSGSYTITKVAAPSFSPGAGTYTSVQPVKITTATKGASIRYTTDGSTPTTTHGTLYSGSINISKTTTLKAIAYKSGFTNSTVTTAIYTIKLPPRLNFEAEDLSYTPCGATASVQTDPKASAGKWVELAATGTGQYIKFTLPNVLAGTYQLKMEWKSNNNRGILQLSVDGTNLGSTLDQYTSGQTYPTTTFGNVTFSSAGNHIIQLIVTGKNKSSSNYHLSADKFTLVEQ